MSAAETKSTARVTGDPSGIGAIHADRLTRRGFDLILIGNQNRLAALAQRPKNETGRSVEKIVADLNDTADLRASIVVAIRMPDSWE